MLKVGDTFEQALYEGYCAVYTVVGYDALNRPISELKRLYKAGEKKTEIKEEEPKQITIEETVRARETKKTTAKRK